MLQDTQQAKRDLKEMQQALEAAHEAHGREVPALEKAARDAKAELASAQARA